MKLTSNFFSSKFDTFYRSLLLSKFFIKGWGEPEQMKDIFNFRKILSCREKCKLLVDPNQPIYINKTIEKTSEYNLFEGHFKSPLIDYLPLPKSCEIATFQMIEPSQKKFEELKLKNNIKPVVIHLAGTGDHFYWKRRNFMAKPLLKYGITSIILENPFYGERKPPEQKNSCLLNVSDLFLMGGCLVLECLTLLNWLEKSGYGPLGVTGISLGGHMCSIAGASWDKPLSIIPCLSWTTASCVFTQGVLSGAIPWDVLVEQYEIFGNKTINDLKDLLNSPEENDIFHAGRNFAKQYRKKNNLKELHIDKLNKLKKNRSDEQDNISKILSSLNFNNDNINKVDENEEKIEENLYNALNFMRGIMDECTHLGNFDLPVDCELSIILNATYDGYVPKSNLIPLNELWFGSTLRTIDSGHVTAILFYHKLFQQAIVDSLDLNAKKYYNSKIIENNLLEKLDKN